MAVRTVLKIPANLCDVWVVAFFLGAEFSGTLPTNQ